MRIRSALALFVALLSWFASAGAMDLERPLILVARPELRGALFGAAVLVVTPAGGGRHAGFIVNRPTNFHLVLSGPGTASSHAVAPLHLGGPVEPQQLFALVPGSKSPGGNSFEVLRGLYAAYEPDVLLRIFQAQKDRARFLAGYVVWDAGELRAEIDRGAWYVLEADAALVAGSSDGLWEELVRRSERAASALWAFLAPNLN